MKMARFARCLCFGAIPLAGMAKETPPWISQANNAFALDLYARVAADKPGNLFFSPNSIETALAMTYAGARGKTAAEMAAVLHLPPGDAAIHPDLGAFLEELNGGGKPRGYQLSVANALWGETGYRFLPGFLSLLKSDYDAGLEQLDFRNDSEGARKTINAWVEKKTAEKIKDLIGQGVLTPDTRLVLTNAIYFKGSWTTPLRKKPLMMSRFIARPHRIRSYR